MLSSKLWTLALSCVLALVTQAVAASGVGGAEPFAKLSANVAQSNDSSPLLAQAALTAVAAGAPGALAAVPKSGTGTVLGVVAAGLGLAWLASTLGFGETVAQILLLALIAVTILAALGLLRRRRTAVVSDLAYPAAGSGPGAGRGNSQLNAVTPRGYSPQNVGNDASARPWEQLPAMPELVAVPVADSASGGAPGWGVHAGFDTEGFLKASKANFISLQAAWDRSDIAALRARMTDGMLEQIKVQLAEREQTQGAAANQTEVVMLEARLLGVEEIGVGYMASVEFSGLIREEASAGPNPFREVWNITRVKVGPGGWLVAGVQALQ